MTRIGAAIVTMAVLLPTIPVNAMELRVISAGAVRGVVEGMIDDYSKKTGIKFNFTTGPTGLLRDTIASGKPADLIIASAPLMSELEATGKMLPGSKVDLGRLGLGVVIRSGAAAPDISTPDALKQTLLKAQSIAHTDPKFGGTSVIHLMKIADGLGIGTEVRKKSVNATGGNDAVAKVAKGEAEIAVVLVSEIHDKGAKLAAMLPEPLQL
ncbi:MAG TPA: substrate-binding domain-containing protein, partial [Burkholderiaceae bacterium]|nr:substrate-binding domain-containing protein [Burkholderiaceae bacterium]